MYKSFLIFLCLISGIVKAQEVPDSLLVKARLTTSPMLLLTAGEVTDINKKIQTLPWAKVAWKNITTAADSYIKEPFYFPENEGGWTHQYVCPISGAALQFDKNSPHKHYCEDCKKTYEGVILDRAWNSLAMTEVSRRMEVLAIASMISKDKKYGNALKDLYLDAANKYEKYRIHDRSFKLFGDSADDIAGKAMSQSIDECNLLTKLALSYDGLVASNVLTAGEKNDIDRKIWGNANKMMHRILDRHPSGGNWWVWHSAGGLVVGLLTNDAPLIDQAINDPKIGILKMLRSNYLNEDGLASENSPGYQLFAMIAMSRMAMISKHIGMGFEKIPAVEKAFYAMAQFHYPDFTLPNMNDGRRNDTKTSGTLTSEMTSLDFLELGWGIYHSDPVMKHLSEIYNTYGQDEIRSKGIFPLLYGPLKVDQYVKEDGGTGSVSLKSGIAMLRSSDKDWNVLLKNTNPGNGHAHPNSLQVAMFANGEEFIPSFGTPEYGHYSYLQWFTQTLAHNTVSVNAKNQNRKKVINKIDWIAKKGPVTAVSASVINVQDPQKDLGKALSLSRTLVVSPLAIYDFLNVSEDTLSKKKFTEAINSLDWTMHFNGKMNWNSSLSASSDKLVPDAVVNSVDAYPAYHLLTDLKNIDLKGPVLQGVLSQPSGGNVSVSLFSPQKDERDYFAMGLGYENSVDKKLPLIIRRIRSNQVTIGGIYVPFKGNNPVQDVDVLKQTPNGFVVSVVVNNGTEVIFKNGKSANVSVRDKEGSSFSFEGILALITSQKDKDKRYFLVGKTVSDAAGTLSADREVPISLVLTAKGPVVENPGNVAVTVTWKPAKGLLKTFVLKPKSE